MITGVEYLHLRLLHLDSLQLQSDDLHQLGLRRLAEVKVQGHHVGRCREAARRPAELLDVVFVVATRGNAGRRRRRRITVVDARCVAPSLVVRRQIGRRRRTASVEAVQRRVVARRRWRHLAPGGRMSAAERQRLLDGRRAAVTEAEASLELRRERSRRGVTAATRRRHAAPVAQHQPDVGRVFAPLEQGGERVGARRQPVLRLAPTLEQREPPRPPGGGGENRDDVATRRVGIHAAHDARQPVHPYLQLHLARPAGRRAIHPHRRDVL